MTNINISPKGRALLKKSYSSSKVLRAIVAGGDKLTSEDGLIVEVDGKKVKLKAAPVSNNPVVLPNY